MAGNKSVTISWSTVKTASSYNVYRSAAAGLAGTAITSGTGTMFNDTTVSNGSTYYYSVSAVNSAGESASSGQVSATPADLLSSATVTISAVVRYQDKEYDLNGFTGNKPYKAVRYATIEIVDHAGIVLASGCTGSDGSYVVSAPTSTASSLYVRVLAQATPPSNAVPVEVKNLSGSLYAVGGSNFMPSGPSGVTISIAADSIGGAFNILDVFTTGFEFVNSLASYPSVTLSGYWQPGNTNGTYFSPGGIYILNTSTDTDEYDDDVLYHEFGHFTAYCFSRDDSPGGRHGLVDNDLDMRLAWSEGWGDAFPGAVKRRLHSISADNLLSSVNTPLTQYVDTIGSAAGISIDMKNPDGAYGYGSRYFSYATGEIAIAKILLELNTAFGMQHVWDVFADFKAHPPANPALPVNVELFWDRWHSLLKPLNAGAVTIDSIFADRSIDYSDLYSGDTFSTATTIMTGETQTHNLYPADDADYVVFSAVSGGNYTITTTRLTNGADTWLELYSQDSLSTPLKVSDNASPYSATYSAYAVPSDVFPALCDTPYGPCHENRSNVLGSSIVFTASYTGPHYLKIYSSPARPVSAGRYGTYLLTLTSP